MGSGPARARRRASGAVREAPARRDEEGACETRGQGADGRVVQRSDEGDGQAARFVRRPARRTREDGRAEHPVSQVHGAREVPGIEAEEGRRAGSRVSGICEGREAELYGEGIEGRKVSKVAWLGKRGREGFSVSRVKTPPDPFPSQAELRVRPW